MSSKLSYFAAAGLAVVALGVVPALAQETAAPAAVTQAPADPAAVAAPATEAAPEVAAAQAPAEPPPTLPTTGDGAAIIKVLNSVCAPLIKGGDFVALAKSAGMTRDRKTEEYVTPLSQKPFQIAIAQPSERNKNVCEMRVRYAPGWDAQIVDAMNVWRFLHEPQLRLQRNDVGQYKDAQRTTTTWDNWDNQTFDGKMIGLVLVQLNKADGGPATATYDEAIVQYSARAALPAQPPVAQTPTAAPAAPAG